MGTPYVGEVKIISWNFAPQGWAFCNGQFLPINQNQALFSLLGTMYGGNGQTTFALPDMRGRVAIHQSNDFTVGQAGGQAAHTVTLSEMPQHLHFLNCTNNAGTAKTASGNVYAKSLQSAYGSPSGLVAMSAETVTSVGGSQPHLNMQPYSCVNFIIALVGVFPSRN